MKNNQNNKHKNVLFIKSTQGIAKMRSLAVVKGLFTIVSRLFYLVNSSTGHQNGSTSRARTLSLFGLQQNKVRRIGLTSRARLLSRFGVFANISTLIRLVSSTSRARLSSLLGVLIVTLSVLVAMPLTGQAQAATSNQLNFQGRLLTSTGALVPDGTYNMEFNLYNVATGGSTLWTEDRLNTNTQGVTVKNGYFSVYLGQYDSFPALDWSEDLYLGMTIRGTGSCAWGACTPADSEMTPRFKLTSVPYAFRAANVASSNTNSATSNSDAVSITTGDALGVTSNSGNITIDTGTATGTAGTISLGSANASALSLGRTGVTTTNNGALTVTQLLTANGNLSISGGTDFGVYYRDGSDNVVTTAAGATGECFRGATGAAPVWGSCAGTGDIVQNGNSFTAAMTIGTNDVYDLNLETSGTTRITVSATGTTTFNGPVVLAASQSLTLTGGNTASRPGSPTEGMIYFDTTTDSLITYSNGKWQSDRGEYVVVAANDSTQAEKDSADYVADGTADQTEINSALTAAAGGKVILLPGTYVADATILIPNNTTLAGSGPGTVIELADLDVTDNLIENSDTTTGTGVVIQDLNIDGRSDLNTAGTQYGIYMNNMGDVATSLDGARISNVSVTRMRFTGVRFASSANSTLQNSRVSSSAAASNILVDASENIKILNVTSVSSFSAGIVLNATTDSSIIGSNTSNNTGHGIAVQASSSNNVVDSNVSSGNGSTGIFINSSSTYNTISNNVVQNSAGTAGILLQSSSSYNIIDSNSVSGSTFYGISLSLGTNQNTISNNYVSNSGLAGVNTNSAANNLITGNFIKDSGGATNNNGINLNSSYDIITNNKIEDSSCTTTCYAINITNSFSTNTYLADNTYYTTAGTDQATINDAGTGTRYASQLTPAAVLQSGSSLIRANATSVLTGTIDPAASTTVTGVGTKFTTELQVGDRITVTGETRTVTAIASDTSLTVDTAFTDNANDLTPDRLPAALVVSDSTGAAKVVVKDDGSLNVWQGTTVLGTSTQAGSLVVSDGSSNTVTLQASATAGNYTLSIPTLTGNDTICVLSGNCSGLGGLQASYDVGNTITTTNARDIDFTLADTATDGNLKVTIATGSTGGLQIFNGATLGLSYTTANGLSVPGGSGISSQQFGYGSVASGSNTVALGYNANVSSYNSVAIGSNANISSYNSVAIGSNVTVASSSAVAIGSGITTGGTSSGSVAIGAGSAVSRNNTAIGAGAIANGFASGSVAIGYNSVAGSGSYQTGVAIGNEASATFSNSIAIGGSNATATATNQLVVNAVTQGYFGNGVTNAAPSAFTLNATGGSGTDIAGANLSIAGGRGTGSGAGGSLLFQTSTAGASGTTLRALTTRLTIDTNGLATFANNVAVTGTQINTGLLTLNGGLTVEAGDTFTFNGDAFTDFTGGGLVNTGGVLTVDTTSATGFFRQGGNSFAATATIGTNDANILSLETTNVSRFQVAAASATFTGQGATTFTSTAALNLSSAAGSALNVTTGTTGALTLDTGTTGTINLGVNANAKTINIGTGAAVVQTINMGGTGANVIGIGNTQTAGSISLGAAMTTGTISIGGTGLQTGTISLGTGTGAQTINLGTGGTGAKTVTLGSTASTGSTTINAGSGFINFNATQAQFSEVTGTRTLTVQTRTAANVGSGLTIAAGTGNGANSGGVLTLQGGNAGASGNINGANVVIAGGLGNGTGVRGVVSLAPTVFSAATLQVFTGSANITQANIDGSSTILISSNASKYTATLSDPTILSAGRIIYVINAGAFDMTLSANSGTENITLKPNTSATMVWNGVDWTAAGASSSTDFQAAYNNTAISAGGAELILNAPGGAADGLTIRNNPVTAITGGLLEVQTAIGSNLFSVNNNTIEYATNGGAETEGGSATTFPANTWDATTGGTVSRFTTTGPFIATGQGSVSVVTTSTNHGARNRINTTLTTGLTYTVSFAVRGTTNFSTLEARYSPDGTTSGTTVCSVATDPVTTSYTVTSGQWARITCSFVASGTITSANSILIRQTDATGRTFYIDNISVNVNASVTYVADGSVDNVLGFATNWSNYQPAGTATVAREASIIYDTNGSARVTNSATAGIGIRNNLAVPPALNTQYLVTFFARSSVAMSGTLRVGFLPAGGTGAPVGEAACYDYNTQSLITTTWVKVTCLLTTGATAISNPDLVIYQSDATERIIYVDALTMTLNTNNSNNVQVGGANRGGPVTLFTLDRSAALPIAANNDAYLGSMYYDTTTGRIQCYEADGWGSCGAAPDNIINLNPEYAGAVLNGSGVGTMTTDFCAEQAGVLNVNITLCDIGQAKNYYKWTSPQATSQTYSIYVTYQLPSRFNGFASDDTVQLVARTDSLTNAAVTYEMFKSTGSVVTQCGIGETTAVTTANTWQSVGINGNEATDCNFNSSSAGNFIIFKINMKANSNASSYVSTLSFTTTSR